MMMMSQDTDECNELKNCFHAKTPDGKVEVTGYFNSYPKLIKGITEVVGKKRFDLYVDIDETYMKKKSVCCNDEAAAVVVVGSKRPYPSSFVAAPSFSGEGGCDVASGSLKGGDEVKCIEIAGIKVVEKQLTARCFKKLMCMSLVNGDGMVHLVIANLKKETEIVTRSVLARRAAVNAARHESVRPPPTNLPMAFYIGAVAAAGAAGGAAAADNGALAGGVVVAKSVGQSYDTEDDDDTEDDGYGG